MWVKGRAGTEGIGLGVRVRGSASHHGLGGGAQALNYTGSSSNPGFAFNQLWNLEQTSSGLSFLICEMGTIMTSQVCGVRIRRLNM